MATRVHADRGAAGDARQRRGQAAALQMGKRTRGGRSDDQAGAERALHEAPRVLLTERAFARGLGALARRDPDLAGIVARWGPPPMWVRPPGFATLLWIILEQQVSLASARAAFERLRARVRRVTPRRLLALDDAALRRIGFSRQKAAYARHLAESMLARRFRPGVLRRLSDEAALARLVRLKGIGVWSAHIYLLMALRRPDVWPKDDLALAVAVQSVKRLVARPTPDELDALGASWKPWRAVAARLLWHHYLSSRASGAEQASVREPGGAAPGDKNARPGGAGGLTRTARRRIPAD